MLTTVYNNTTVVAASSAQDVLAPSDHNSRLPQDKTFRFFDKRPPAYSDNSTKSATNDRSVLHTTKGETSDSTSSTSVSSDFVLLTLIAVSDPNVLSACFDCCLCLVQCVPEVLGCVCSAVCS